MKNQLVADIFRSIAELLEIKGDNPFRIRAYLRAADTVENLKEDIELCVNEGRLRDIAGIGEDLANKIIEITQTGKCKHYEELKKIVPGGVVSMLEIPSVGPKTAKLIFEKLHIKTLPDLEKAAKSGRLLSLPGVKQKTVENILKGLALVKKGKERIDISSASVAADVFVNGLRKLKEASSVAAAGSLRRMKDTVKDVDILVSSKKSKIISDAFIGMPNVKRVLSEGDTKCSVLTEDDLQVDLRVVEPGSFGSALVYFTGSKNHNIRLRSLALKKGLKINEYGIFDKKGRCLASKTEQDIYKFLGLEFIEPELREDSGEIEASMAGRLPKLLKLEDVKGDFHVHTNYSDGKGSVEDMVLAAKGLGYDYVCLSDHSVSLKVARGLDSKRLKEKKAAIDRINKRLKDFKVLFGSEVEIDSEGKLDYKEDILKNFDVVIAAIHSGFKQSKKQLTKRMVRACQNKYVHIIAHPTCKLWPTRESLDLDFKEIFKAARENNTALEINAHPSRMDLSDTNSRWAKDNKVRLAISTDSHAVAHLNYMKFGLGLARRAWLEKGDCLNSLDLGALLKTIKK